LTQRIRRQGDHYFAFGDYTDVWEAVLDGVSGKVRYGLISYSFSLSSYIQGDRKTDKRDIRKQDLDRQSSSGKTSTINNILLVQPFLERLLEHGAVWLRLNHPNVAKFYGLTFELPHMPGLVLECYPNGNINEYLEKNPSISIEGKLRLVRNDNVMLVRDVPLTNNR
jgi:hypothetical protein